jgi:hypothetical protein
MVVNQGDQYDIISLGPYLLEDIRCNCLQCIDGEACRIRSRRFLLRFHSFAMGVIRVSWINWPPHQGRSGTGYSAVLTLKEDKLKVAGLRVS